MIQGEYLEVNRGSDNRTGWNSIMGSFMISKSTNNLRITEKKIMRFGDATNVHGRAIYRIYSRK